MTIGDNKRGGASDEQPQPPASIMRWAIWLRDAYGEGRLSAVALLDRVARRLAMAAAHPDRTDFLRTALCKAFGARDAEGVALRSNIETLVEGDEMSPSAAESWTRTFGWRPFTGWADPALFDPMAQEFWTLPMTAAWIRWHKLDRSGEAYVDEDTDKDATKDYWRKRDYARVIEQVRRHWHTYIAESTRWIEVERVALPDEQRPPACDDASSRVQERVKRGFVVGLREDRGWSDLPGEKTDTKRPLCEALASGQLKAQRFVNGEFVVIPREEWSALNDESSALKIVGFPDDDGVYDGAGVYKAIAPDGAEHLAVRVPRKQVMLAFPSPIQESAEDWIAKLESRVKADPRYTQTLAIDEMKQFAAERGIIIGDEDVKAAWKRAKGIEGKAKPGPTGPRQKAR